MNSPKLRSPSPVLSAALALLAGAALASSCKQGPSPIPEPSPEAAPQDTPGAAERAAIGSSTLGRPSPALADPAQAIADEEAGLTVTTSINEAKKAAAARAAASAKPIAKPIANSSTAPVTEAAGKVTLVFAASGAGQLVPCGCSPDQRGGLPRAAGLLKRWRAEGPGLVYVDAGDLLFESATPRTGALALQVELKARTLAKGSALLGAAARVVGRRDLALGPAFVAETAAMVPLLDGGAQAAGTRGSLLVKGGSSGVPIGLFAAGDTGVPPTEAALAARVVDLRKAGARLIVLLLHPRGERALSAAAALQPAAKAAGVDLIVLGRRDDPGQDADIVQPGSPPLLAPEGHGQTLLRIDLVFPPVSPNLPAAAAPLFLARGEGGKRADLEGLDQRLALLQERAAGADAGMKAALQAKIAELEQRRKAAEGAVEQAPPDAIVATVRFAKLDKSAPDEAAAVALVSAYDREVASQNLAAASLQPEQCPRAAAGEASFIGLSAPVKKTESCATCHPGEAAFWARTRHARAYATLVNAGKQFSLDCISCHVTGWQQPGGVCRIDKTGLGGPGVATPPPAERIGPGEHDALPARLGVGRQDVQCESCHGPASLHLTGGDLPRQVPASTCLRCHEAENSPHFDYQKYLPWVTGPGHGEPLRPGEAPRTRGELTAGNTRGPNPELHLQGAAP